ncbi:MAG: replication-associated recombination protein A [Armatimonadota bacterium]
MPLAARMRPHTLDEFVGQDHIAGPGTWLRTAIETDQLSSIILYGPAGTGKSTLAHIIAHYTKAKFEPYSAVTSGVADIRRVTQQARERMKTTGQKTILFVDEIHRFNKAQQDAFLPFVEDGTIILIGSTTENPFFEINAPLVSRSRIFVFEPLTPEQVGAIVDRALADSEHGLGRLNVELMPEARDHIVDLSGGDARAALNALEAAAQLARPADGKRTIRVQTVEDAAQRRLLRYDKGGDTHYDVISAYIKSLRGGDPDAAIYWLARMLAAGEDPRFIARRLVIQAAEDVGNADPMALVIANAAAHAVEYVGLPEAQIPLAQATAYVATAPKSNASYLAIARASEDVRSRAVPLVPKHLRDANYPGAKQLGHGEGYRYPHDYPDHYTPQEYLPEGTKSRRYYEPTEQGYEKKIKARMEEWEKQNERAKSPDANRRDKGN